MRSAALTLAEASYLATDYQAKFQHSFSIDRKLCLTSSIFITMKKAFILLFTGVAITATVHAQKTESSKVPASVKESFSKQFPDAKAKWEKENGKYEAEFKKDGHSMSALFEADGTITETETGMDASALPPVVLSYVKDHYKGKTIKEAAKITKSNGTVNYEAEVGGKDLIFDAHGNFLKAEKE